MGTKAEYLSLEGRVTHVWADLGAFVLLDRLTGHRTTVFYTAPLKAPRVGERCHVAGRGDTNDNGDALCMTADEIDPIPPDCELPTIDDLRGSLGTGHFAADEDDE
jgi:hypothetical protein